MLPFHRLLDFLCLNTEFRDGGLSVTWKKPYDALAESIDAANKSGVAFDGSSDAHQVWLPFVDGVRTMCLRPSAETRFQMQVLEGGV